MVNYNRRIGQGEAAGGKRGRSSTLLRTLISYFFASIFFLNLLTLHWKPKVFNSAPIYCSHLQEIISLFFNPIPCFTHGSKSKNRVGFAFSVGDTTAP